MIDTSMFAFLSTKHIKDHKHVVNNSGFALVIALSLMAFLLLLILSISTLVQVDLRAANIERDRMEAEQNALLGMQVAVGELQLHLGPDQRVSSSAAILSNTHPSKKNITGVWVSAPGGTVIDGTNHKEGDLIRWLISDSDGLSHHTTALGSDSVKLVGVGSLQDNEDDGISDTLEDEVSVSTSIINPSEATSGHYGWWIGDEGIKATINLADMSVQSGLDENDIKPAAISTMATSARADLGLLPGLSSIDLQSDEFAERVYSLNDLSLDTPAPDLQQIKSYFHDLTTYSMGVISNTQGGGLKKDLSLAFEMGDADFDASTFGSAGPDTIMSTGFGSVQPIFRLANSTNVDANGPTWHLLRDYYTIYQRMQSPMQDPTFNAQAMVPNRAELGKPNTWHDLTALRYIADDAIEGAGQGDPLRTDGGELSIPVKASYLPYLQRNLVTMGLQFEDVMPPAGDSSGHDFQRMQFLLNPSFVVHNPFNVKIQHKGLVSVVDLVRFRVVINSLVDDNYDAEGSTGNHRHMMKTEPDTLDAGEVKIYEGVKEKSYDHFSQAGLPLNFWAPPDGDTIDYAYADNYVDIPIDPDDGPNLGITYKPFANNQWTYRAFHSISIPATGDDTIPMNMTTTQLTNGGVKLSSYSGHHSQQIWVNYKEWYNGEQENEERVMTTTDFDTVTGAVYPFINYDFFIKPAKFDSSTNRFPYPGLIHTNPLAPIMMSTNLFPTSKDTPNYGWPLYSPNWQLNIYTTGLAPGIDVLESFGNNNENGFWGAANSSEGQTNVPIIELPTSPPLSLGQLQNANIGIYSHMPALAIGNSLASPYVQRENVYEMYKNKEGNNRIFYDLSYLSNEALWDDYFFSSYSLPYNPNSDTYEGNAGDSFDIAFNPGNYAGNSTLTSLPNSRMQLFSSTESTSAIRTKLFDNSGQPKSNSFERSAENLLIKGSFNINSTSVDAWKVILSAGRNLLVYQSGQTTKSNYTDGDIALSRFQQPTAGAFNNGSIDDEEAWGGFANFKENQIENLAIAIVNEIKLRVIAQNEPPFLSLADFVNRKLSSDEFGLSGLLQAAIDKSGINDAFNNSKISATDLNSGDAGSFPYSSNIENSEGTRSTTTNASPNLTQADLLQSIGSFINVRSDTFRIRSYGDKRDPVTQKVIARAWCEAIVQRLPEPIHPSVDDPSDAAYWEPKAGDPFGRAFKIVSFRWLNEDDV